MKLIECPGAKMIFSWKRVPSMEKGVDDGMMQVYGIEGVHLCQSHIRLL